MKDGGGGDDDMYNDDDVYESPSLYYLYCHCRNDDRYGSCDVTDGYDDDDDDDDNDDDKYEAFCKIVTSGQPPFPDC